MKITAKWIKQINKQGDAIDVVDVNGKTLYRKPNASSGIILDSLSKNKNIITGEFIADAIRLAIIEQDKTITITTDHSASSYNQPVVLLDDKLTDLHNYLT